MKHLISFISILTFSHLALASDSTHSSGSPIVLKGAPTAAPQGAPVLDAYQAAQGQPTQIYPPSNAPAANEVHHATPTPQPKPKAAQSRPKHKAVEQAHTMHVQHHSAPVHHSATAVPADQALKWLKNGNARFRKGWFRKDGRSHADIKRLSTGQNPHSIVLSCSDSRVPPEHVFDQGLGEIFTVRTAGEALDNNVIASIEYAVEHLGSKLIVVMGHTHCGAVKAAISAQDGQSVGSPALDALVTDIKPRLPAYAHPTKDVGAESSQNAKGVAEELVKRSKIIAEKVSSGEVKIEPALYHVESGQIDWN